MFKFLKDKLKSWIGKTKERVEESNIVEAKKQAKTKPKEPKKEKKLKSKEEILIERKITEKVVKDIKKEQEIKTPEELFEAEERVSKEKTEEKSFFSKFKKLFTYKITKSVFEEVFEDLELSLLENNVAIEVVDKIKADLRNELIDKEVKKSDIEEEIKNSLRKALEQILIQPADIIEEIKLFRKTNQEPYKILFFGINGAGKTTSIAKFANLCIKNKLSCVLAAGDTFRAAAIEQIQIHADRLGIKVIKKDYQADPSSVAFDSIKYAQANNIDVVLIDTAGRMHTKENLLHEMEKICRVSKPNLKVFVAEAIAGNDATEQAKAFNETAGIDGSILSKVDVDEKGGTIISISYITKKPILYLGVGQEYDDLELFNKEKFIEKLGL